MKRIILIVVGVLFALAIGVFSLITFFPGTVVSTMQSMAAGSSGLSKETAILDGREANYYIGGPEDAPALVLLHGLGDDKNTFVTSVDKLTDSYRVILPDLAAHGENAQLAGQNYSIKGQVEFIDALLETIGTSSVVIGGNSMGGHTAAAYAYHFPEKTDALILLNATGMQLDRDSVYLYYPDVVDRAYIDEMFGRVFAQDPKIPGFFIDYMIDDLQPKIPFMNALISEVESGEDFRLDEKAREISAPTLLLWGEADPVVPVIYAEGFDAAIPNSKLIVLENAGHSPQFEIPNELQEQFLTFMGEYETMAAAPQNTELDDVARIENGYIEHGALSQLHRWYLGYEHPESGLDNLLDILTDDVELISAAGTSNGKSALEERFKALPQGWDHAHFLQDAEVVVGDQGQISLEAEIVYLNRGMLENDQIRQGRVAYSTVLIHSADPLPKFTSFDIELKSETVSEDFRDAYPENRLLSLAHYWLAILEQPSKDAAPAAEILAPGFSLNFPSGAVTTFEQFSDWYAGRAAQVKANTHTISDFSYERLGENEYRLTMDVDWQGIRLDDVRMSGKVRHSWLVTDTPLERFARIKTLDVEILEPFGIKP